MNLVFDLETDGLLDDFSQIHCLCIHDLDTKETITFNDIGTGSDSIVRGAEYLADADHIIGHNAIGFDCPVLSRVYPWWKPSGQVLDTLLLSRLYHPNRYDLDEKQYGNKKGDDILPLRLWGRHSLESYGWRLGEHKDDFGKETDWKTWSPEMEAYMETDVKVTTLLWHHFVKFLTG